MLECMARASGLGRAGDMAPHGVVLFQSRFDVEARAQLVLARQCQAVWLGIHDGDLYKACVISAAAKPSFKDAQTISGTSHCFEMLRAILLLRP